MRSAIAFALAIVTGILLAAGSASALEESFPRPPGIHARVRLWTRVYSEVDTNGGLIHDAEELDVVYEVIRWPKTLSAADQEARIARSKRHYQAILERLADGKTALTAEERRVLTLFPPGVSRASLGAAVDRVRFQRGLAERFRDGLVRAGQWEPHIRRVFRDAGLPQELASLPHVESSFNPGAYSKVGAAGLWQFMPGTGKRFLRIDRAVDERYDPWRSSEAAAALLRENHRITGAWPLAVTAYNHGAGGMMRAVKQLGTKDISVIIDRYQSETFGFASRNFYSEFLAALDVEKAAGRHFGAIAREPAAEHEIVVTRHPTSASALARTFGVDPGLLRELNMGLRDSVWSGRISVPAGYAVRLPKVAGRPPAAQLAASLPRSEEVSARDAGPRGSASRHRIRRGDTLTKVAKTYGVSASALAKTNGLRTSSHLRVGQTLRIPGAAAASETSIAAAPAAKTTAAKAATTTPSTARKQAPTRAVKAAKTGKAKPAVRSHTVKQGETLTAIARQTGVSVKQLAAANGISASHRVRAGQRLRIPD
ncbi:MAG: LysM peptidoglycan-binding protein [Deltaproteobacteria bacterium]|nr:LysM peptidoglycan-binding protein [Deltaproteobacteria bacterium]